MSETERFDVIVVGAGPGGAVTAKRCAKAGLKTVILERRALPREKVCSGMLFGRQAQELVQQEFGSVPREVVLRKLKGAVLVVPGVGQEKVPFEMPITWRRDLDYWMVAKAREEGAEVRDSTWVRSVTADGNGLAIVARKGGVEQELTARFLVGADGPASIVRKSVYPDLKLTYTTSTRECFDGSLNLDSDYSHIVFPRQQYRPNFWINPKGDCFTVEGALKELKGAIADFLSGVGLADRRPKWKDGCVSRPLPFFEHLATGRLTAAVGNALLVGDAASLKIPLSGEGIGTALKSGILAAESIIDSIRTGHPVSRIYGELLQPTLRSLEACYRLLEDMRTKQGSVFLEAAARAFEDSVSAPDC